MGIITIDLDIRRRIKELGKHTSIYSLSSVAQSAMSFFLLPLYVNKFTTSEYGAYTLLLMCSGIGSAIFYLGINSALPSSYYEYSDEIDREKVFNASFYLTLAGAILLSILGLTIASPLSELIFNTPDYRWHIVVSCISSSFYILNQLILTYYRLKKKSVLVAGTSFASVAANLILVYVLLTFSNLGVWAPILTTVFIQIIVFGIYFVNIGSCLRHGIMKREISAQMRFGILTVLSGLAAMAIEWSDRIFLKNILSLADVGVYSLALRLGSIATPLLITPFAMVWRPMIMELKNDTKNAQLVKHVLVLYCLASFAVILGSQLFTIDVFRWFVKTTEYHRASSLVPIVAAGIMAGGLMNITCMGYLYVGKIGKMAVPYYICAPLSLLLNWQLIPRFGLSGAAFTSLLINVLLPTLSYTGIRSHFHLPVDWFRIAKIACLFALANILIRYFQLNVRDGHLLAKIFIITLFLYGGVYFAVGGK
ncbi:MAG TPA: oligosaccharide flippase family protein, partial [Oligoflexus sp.]|uniref:lipopolysaccharide biosynthesis protein n=1 Tax=Oligoflexus sp. TaxID=1971216 RepID=UPI002D2BAF1E